MFHLVTGKGFREGEASRMEERGGKGHTSKTSAGWFSKFVRSSLGKHAIQQPVRMKCV